MEKLYRLTAELYEDSYTEGEGSFKGAYKVEYKKLNDLLIETGLKIEDFEFDEENGIYFADKISDIDFNAPSKNKIEEWKKGKIKLYNASYEVKAFELKPCKLLNEV